MLFCPLLGNFVLLWYQGSCNLGPPIKGFYQLSMDFEDEGAFWFRLNLMEGGYRSPLTMEFCTVTKPFPRRRVIFVDGSPSVGSISTTEHSVEWKMIEALMGKSLDVTFPGTVKFAPRKVGGFLLPTLPLGTCLKRRVMLSQKAVGWWRKWEKTSLQNF